MTKQNQPGTIECDAEVRIGTSEEEANRSQEQTLQSRRSFLLGLGKWSRAVIVGAVAGGALLTDNPAQAAGWINRRGGGGGGWVNGRSGEAAGPIAVAVVLAAVGSTDAEQSRQLVDS